MMGHVELISDDQYGNVGGHFDYLPFDVVPRPRFGDVEDEQHACRTLVDIEKFSVERDFSDRHMSRVG